MDILYEGQIFAIQKAGGINRYFANLISRLPEDCIPTLTTRRDLGVHVPVHPRLKIKQYYPFRPHRVSQRLEKAYFRSLQRVHRYTVAHPTYYSLPALLGGSLDRGDLIEKGRQRAKKFSWDKTAAQTVEVYRKVAG